MQIVVRGGAAERVAADALVLGIFEGTSRPSGAAQAVDKAAGGAIRELLKSGDFTGKAGQCVVLYPTQRHASRASSSSASAPRRSSTTERVRQAAGTRGHASARQLGVKTLATVVARRAARAGSTPTDAAQAVVEGSVLGNYVFGGYLTQDKDRKRQVQVAGASSRPTERSWRGRHARREAGRDAAPSGVAVTRDLCEPRRART